MSVSIIIPTLNDEQAVKALLTCIRAWNDDTQKLIEEIIVVDATASKECQDMCTQHNAKWLSYKKNRGAQLKFGAAHAKAKVLWFLHADSGITPESLSDLNKAINNGSCGGFFKFKFNSAELSFSQKIITYFTNWRSKYFTAYGDQAIFVEKDFYNIHGGHSDQSLFEEVQLIKALRKNGQLHISNIPVAVSTRRWDKDGYWKRTLHNRLLALAYKFGVSTEKLSQWYTAKKVQ